MNPQPQQCLIEVENPEAATHAEFARETGIRDYVPLPPRLIRFETYTPPGIGDDLAIAAGTDTVGTIRIRVTKRTFICAENNQAADLVLKLEGDPV